jgi:hypothetical protein
MAASDVPPPVGWFVTLMTLGPVTEQQVRLDDLTKCQSQLLAAVSAKQENAHWWEEFWVLEYRLVCYWLEPGAHGQAH